MAGEHKASDFAQAFAALAADQVQDLSDEDLGWYAQATVAVLEAIDTELKRRIAIKAERPDIIGKPIGRG